METLHMNEVLIVIVLYKTRLEESKTFTSLTQSLTALNARADVLVYDNSPEEQQDVLASTAYWNIHYIRDTSNPGVSKAYNEGASLAKELGKKWILLTDQDTLFPENALDVYLKAIHHHPDQVLIAPILLSPHGIFSPSKYYLKRGFIWKDAHPGTFTFKNKTLLNSGILVKLDAFLAVKGYNEKVKLYFSDFSFIDRLKKSYNTFVVIDLVCQHQLSDIVNTDIEAALNRFKYYCEGSYYSAESKMDYFLLFSTVGLRALKLSLRYKNIKFLKILNSVYLGNQ